MLCDDLESRDGCLGSGREAQEGRDICILTADSHCHKQQKLTQHCKAVILQLKINLKIKVLKVIKSQLFLALSFLQVILKNLC